MTVRVLPGSRPQLPREEAERKLAAFGVKVDRPIILGERGYYQDSMGVRDKNDRGIFDDALIIISPRAYRTFNGNTDPSTKGGRLAVLQPGVWDFEEGIHGRSKPVAKQYEALIQAGPVTVLRDNGVKETGWFGINIHHAGFNTTTSAGCQTVYMGQWDEFRGLYKAELAFYAQERIPYVLTVREDE